MTNGSKEFLEALSPEGKLFPLKAREWTSSHRLQHVFPESYQHIDGIQWSWSEDVHPQQVKGGHLRFTC